MLNVQEIRSFFPQLQRKIHGSKSLCYLDSAASTLKPKRVVDRISEYYLNEACNIHRGVHFLSEQSTLDFENAREDVRTFINAKYLEEIIFTSGTTDSINLVSNTLGKFFQKDDEIILSELEHHSNIVPWQMLAENIGLKIRVIPLNENQELNIGTLQNLITKKTKLISVSYVSNALGIVNPVEEIISLAKSKKIYTLIDAAQAVATHPIDVQKLQCDFLAFSGHKIFGPTGIGVLYGKKDILESLPPWKGGGDMIKHVTFEKTIYNDIPFRFEAGTSHIAGVLGLAEAIKFVQEIGFNYISEHEKMLTRTGKELLSSIKGLKIFGNVEKKVPIFSFIIEGIHDGDLGTLLDLEGIAVRTGHHCAEPLMNSLKISGTCRASCSLYTTKEELVNLTEAILKAQRILI